MKDKYKIKAKSINEGDDLGWQIAELDPKVQQMCSDLRDGKNQIHTLVNTLEGYIFICDHNYRIVFMSTLLVERIGYEAIGELCYKAFHGQNSPCQRCINELVFQGETVRREIQNHKDKRWYYVVSKPIKQGDGSIYKQSIGIDITEFKGVAAALEDHRNQLEGQVKEHTAELTKTNELLQQEIERRKQAENELRKKNNDLIERIKELNCLYSISKLAEWPDLSFEEIFQSIAELIPPAWQHSEVTCARILLGGQEFRTENFRETDWKQKSAIIVFGERIGSLEVSYFEERPESDDGPFMKEEKNLINAIAERLGRIAERMRVEEELRSSEERYRTLAESVAEAVVVVQDERMMFVNDNFVSMFGYPSSDEVVGKDLGILNFPDLKKHFGMQDEAVASGACNESVLQTHCTSLSGRDFWIEARYNFIKWEGRPAFLATLRDVTESKLQPIASEQQKERLLPENKNIRSAMKDRFKFGNIVGKSSAMLEVYDFILRASASDAGVVIEGESGVGKEIVARTIHEMSDRRDKQFVPINCGALPETLFESELFGHKKGAFTGAFIDKPGLFDHAFGGTLFLDEVGELSLNMQVKLLRAIEGNGYIPLGDNTVKQSDVRIIATSNKKLNEMVKKGSMREDFFYRIKIISIILPPLRNRKEDIPLLVDHFLQLYSDEKKATAVPGKIMAALYKYDWPGNIRELQNVLLRYLTMKRFDFIDHDLETRPYKPEHEPLIDFNPENINLRTAVGSLEKTLLLKALNQTNWNRSKAAALLGISRRALYRKAKNLS